MQQAGTAEKLDPGVSLAPESLVKDVSGLVSPPDVCMRVFELLQSADTSAKDIGDVIVQDPNLTARLLKIVNSPFYNFTKRIDTVSRAIAIVGVRDLYNLVIAISAVRSFTNISNDLVSMDTFWRHSLFTALIARSMAQRCRILHPERLFVAGLLHDIGSLVIYNRLPDVARDLVLMAEGNEQLMYEAEREALGFGHPELGALLLNLWHIPQSLQDAVRHHHRPSGAADADRREAAIIHIADVLANGSEIGGFCETPQVGEPEPGSWEALDLNPASLDLEDIVGDAGVEFTETAGLLLQGH